jgi:hypothetical protein
MTCHIYSSKSVYQVDVGELDHSLGYSLHVHQQICKKVWIDWTELD